VGPTLSFMKICIYGAGAIGGYLGTRLAASGHEVSAVARGQTLQALQTQGWRTVHGSGSIEAPAAAVAEDPAALGVQDLVVVAVKGPAMGQVAARIGPLLGEYTTVLPAMNGVPWWFGQGVAAVGEAPLESVDPGGRIAAAIPLRHVVGCVVHISAATAELGLVKHVAGEKLIIGEPAGGTSERVAALQAALQAAGLVVEPSTQIRHPLWFKLWGNLTMNPVSAVTGATIDRILGDPLLRGFCSRAMAEASEIGDRLGCHIDQAPEDRHQVTAQLGAFRTSMLQDVDAGRPLELDAIVTAVQELGRRVGVPTPTIDALLGLTRVFAQVRGLYPDATTA